MQEKKELMSNVRIVLMSMREVYFNEILNGEKHYEYRKKYCEDESIAYIYISKTRKEIVGKIWFGKPIIAEAKKIAQISENDQPGNYNSIIEYIGNNVGYAIPVIKVETINKIGLNEIKESFKEFCPPQSYYYLDNKKGLMDFIADRE